MQEKSKLYNNSHTQLFGLANGRKLLPLSFVEIENNKEIDEANKLVSMFPGILSFQKAENLNETLGNIQTELKIKDNKIAELEKQLAETKLEKEAEENLIISLKEEAKSLGIDTRGKFSVETLQAKIAEVKNTINDAN